MKRVKLWLRIALSLALIAFLVISPAHLPESLNRNFYREWLEKKPEEWSGVITLWHIVDFKSYQGSVTSFLSQCAAAYEKQHPGVYFEVVGMEKSDFDQRIQNGQFPDVYSFPLGALYREQLSAPDITPALLPAFTGVGSSDGVLCAIPYLSSGYFLLGNSVLMQEDNIVLPETFSPEWLKTTLDANRSGKPTLAAPPILAAQLGLAGEFADLSEFTAGNVPLAIGDARTCGDLSRKLSTDGFTFEALPLPGFTDQVQLFGCASKIDPERKAHATAFLELLLGEKQQSSLTALGALPVIDGLPKLTYADDTLQSFYEAQHSPQIPNAFLYHRYRDELLADAQRALAGDVDAKKSFDARMKELLP